LPLRLSAKSAFAESLDDKIDAISVGMDALTQARSGLIVELAGSYKLSTAYPACEFVEAGDLVSYGQIIRISIIGRPRR
jgi:hypothetical protein